MLKIPRALFELEATLARSKELMIRLDKGEDYLAQAIKNGSLNQASDAVILFNKLAKRLNNELEDALFYHEMLTTGRTTVVDRKGRAVNTLTFNPNEERMVDLFTLRTIKQLKEVFGEDALVEFEVES